MITVVIVVYGGLKMINSILVFMFIRDPSKNSVIFENNKTIEFLYILMAHGNGKCDNNCGMLPWTTRWMNIDKLIGYIEESY